MIDAYIKMFKNIVVFSGRATVGEYWWPMLMNIIVAIVLGALVAFAPSLMVLVYVYSIAVWIATLSLTVRRLHDVGLSGLFYLFIFLPVIGGIVLLVMLVRGSQPDNQYGPASPDYDFA